MTDIKIDDEVRALLRDTALVSPLLTYMLTRGSPLVPRVYSIELQWDDVATDHLLDNASQAFQNSEPMYQMFWLQDISYTVRRPLYNAGVFGARQQDEYCKLNPYVDVKIETKGPDVYKLTDGFQPLENIVKAGAAERYWAKRMFVLPKNGNIVVQAYNRRTFETLEVPYIVTLSFIGMELSGCKLASCGYDEVICKLRDEDLYPRPSR